MKQSSYIKQYAMSAFFIGCSLLFLGFVTLCAMQYKTIATKQPQLVNNQNVTVPAYAFVLKAYKNKLAVYAPGESAPLEVLDIYLSTLPTVDVAELRRGIYLKDRGELIKLIHDFDS